MLTGQFVKVLHDLSRIHGYAIYSHTVAALEIEFNIFSVVWCIFGRGRQLIHTLIVIRCRVKPRVFEDACFIRDMEKVAIH